MIWLARLLEPAEFGKIAMAWVVIRVAGPIVTGGIGQAVIQKRTLLKEEFASLFWIQCGLGILVFGVVNLTAGAWGTFFDEPEIPALLLICSFSFLAMPIANSLQSLLTRNLDFNSLAVIQICSAIAELTAAVILAYYGWGVFALAWGFLIRTILAACITIWFARRDIPKPYLNIHPVQSMLRFALFETGNNLVNSTSTVIDKAILARFLTPHDLGLYFIAWELAMIPVSRINPLLTRVSFPLFSQFQDNPEKLNGLFLKTTNALILVNLPFLFALGLFSNHILSVAFGPDWSAAGLCLSLLSILGFGKALVNAGAGVLLAKGRSDLNFSWNLLSTSGITLLLLPTMVFFGTIEAAAITQIMVVMGLLGLWLRYLDKFGGVQLSPFFGMLFRRLLACLPFILVIGIWLLLDIPLGIQLVGGTLSASFVYLLTIIFSEKGIIKKIQ